MHFSKPRYLSLVVKNAAKCGKSESHHKYRECSHA